MADNLQEQIELIIRDANIVGDKARRNPKALNVSDEQRVIKHLKAARKQLSEAGVLF